MAWSHRNRLSDTLLDDGDGDAALEFGVTYELRIYGDGGALKHTESGLTANTFTYVQATEESDNGGSLNTDLRIELRTFRDGLEAHQYHDFTFIRV